MGPRKSTSALPPATRNLPKIRNELMTGEVDVAVLSTKCRVQDVKFGPPEEEGIIETFVRIKTHLPDKEQPHFIMRKAADDYISATSMYRAVFQGTTMAQEKNEMEVVKRELAARSDLNASGVWVPGVPDALQLADVYGIRPWIEALLAAPTTKSAYPDEQRSPSGSVARGSTPMSSVSATPSRRSVRERSQSPRKQIAASSRKVKKAAKDAVHTIKEDFNEVSDAVQNSVLPKVQKVGKAVASEADHTFSSASKPKSEEPSDAVSDLAKALEHSDVEEVKFTTTVASEGKSMSEMVAEARAQVEAAQEKDALALTESGLSSSAASNKKRGIEDEDEELKNQIISVKRSKMEELEVGLVQERRKVRALFGLVLGLGATAILPYIL